MLCYLAGLTLDAVGASSFMWKQQHVVGHHAYTNVIDEDPDIRVKADGSDVRCVVHQQPRGSHHSWQHLYLGALYSLLAFKSIVVDDFSALLSGSIGPVRLSAMAWHEMLAFWAGKAGFAAWFVAAPLTWSQWSAGQLLGLWAVSLACCGWVLAFMFQVRLVLATRYVAVLCSVAFSQVWQCFSFLAADVRMCLCARCACVWTLRLLALFTITQDRLQPCYPVRRTQVQVAHVGDEVAFLQKDAAGNVAGSWAAQQIATSADFAHGSWFWTHASGGLNYQVVHHLFPGVSHTHYPAIAPIVLEAAKRHGVPYKVYPSFWQALRGHFRHLRNVGCSLIVPSLQTVG